MERIKSLNRYQKGILLLLSAMIVIFFVVYSVVTSQVGYLYHNAILIPSQQDGSTIYSGKIDGQEAVFTVTADKEITFLLGDKTYGPYTVKEDPSAKPEEHPMSTGIEIKKGDEILFRGGAYQYSSKLRWHLYNEDGTSYNLYITIGVANDKNDNEIDEAEPSLIAILDLVYGPELTHKGNWPGWFIGIFLSAWTAVCILFADELFRWQLRHRTSDWRFAEPSEWEITRRYIGMTLMVAFILFLYIMGLQ